eukprot:scaffold101_cov373-Prasinococcus_capsulatus_cf.AAC.17
MEGSTTSRLRFVKSKLKDFEHSFHKKYGHRPSKPDLADNEEMAALYKEYGKLKAALTDGTCQHKADTMRGKRKTGQKIRDIGLGGTPERPSGGEREKDASASEGEDSQQTHISCTPIKRQGALAAETPPAVNSIPHQVRKVGSFRYSGLARLPSQRIGFTSPPGQARPDTDCASHGVHEERDKGVGRESPETRSLVMQGSAAGLLGPDSLFASTFRTVIERRRARDATPLQSQPVKGVDEGNDLKLSSPLDAEAPTKVRTSPSHDLHSPQEQGLTSEEICGHGQGRGREPAERPPVLVEIHRCLSSVLLKHPDGLSDGQLYESLPHFNKLQVRKALHELARAGKCSWHEGVWLIAHAHSERLESAQPGSTEETGLMALFRRDELGKLGTFGLRRELKARSLSASGSKHVLVERLTAALRNDDVGREAAPSTNDNTSRDMDKPGCLEPLPTKRKLQSKSKSLCRGKRKKQDFEEKPDPCQSGSTVAPNPNKPVPRKQPRSKAPEGQVNCNFVRHQLRGRKRLNGCKVRRGAGSKRGRGRGRFGGRRKWKEDDPEDTKGGTRMLPEQSAFVGPTADAVGADEQIGTPLIECNATKELVQNTLDNPTEEHLLKVLQHCFGHSKFRPGQLEAIDRVLSRRASLLMLPTGSGKSLCYQLPAVLLSGLTIVVSPLLALMKDQLRSLPPTIPGAMLSGNQSYMEYRQVLQQMQNGFLKVGHWSMATRTQRH